ncbi:HORMA domain-containing protein [Pterulicium gracile]|uniref:HORMA domain-containing protein n=1 Tax=Pterulicium gracile TaxID=1884261 RepID=A0A5C3QZA9_9AGAR|nr:HORMA domain-containing protein [Pterula gracilis]
MQAQRVQNQVGISSAQSLLVVRTLLEAGVGCIAYLRNLLPEDHFEESSLTSSNTDSFSMDQGGSQKGSSTFKIKTLKRGCSEEADKLLDHLEHGILDALEKRFLRRFILGIHLDDTDPNNVVETYAFDFKYCTIPGVAAPVPIISVGESLDAMSIDPVMHSMRQGKLPSVSDVKKSLRSMLRRLISSFDNMDDLPRRRFATFKLIYTEDTPADYEPPTFMAGDVDKNKWFFTTHGRNEHPENWRIGGINSGHHAVKLTISSVTSFLPTSSTNDQAFTGLVPSAGILGRQGAPTDIVGIDDRQHVWLMDDVSDADASADEDPDYIPSIQIKESGPLASPAGFSQESQAPYFTGSVEPVPTSVADISTRRSAVKPGEEFPATQVMDTSTHDLAAGEDTHGASIENDHGDGEAMDVDMECPKQCPMGSSLISDVPTSRTRALRSSMKALRSVDESIGEEIDCECQVETNGDDCILCDGGCARWFHTWCMGYHSRDDPAVPEVFRCFDCRLKSDPLWPVLRGDPYQNMLIKFRELAQFRRAIRVAETSRSFHAQAFAKTMGCNPDMGKSLIDRLEEEGFIASQVTTVNDIGVISVTQKNKGKRGKKKTTQRGQANMQRIPYIFIQKSLQSKAYESYFTPTDDVESRLKATLIGTLTRRETRPAPDHLAAESQTQDETQYPFQAYDDKSSLRNLNSTQDEIRPAKRLKVSVTSAVDLAE